MLLQRRRHSSGGTPAATATEDGLILSNSVHSNMDTGNIAQGAITGKRIKKRKRIVRGDEEMDARNLAEGDLIIKKPKIKDEVRKIPAEGIVYVNIGNAKIRDETQSVCSTVLDDGQAQSVVTKVKKRRKKKKPKLEDEVQKEVNAIATENLDEENATIEKPKVKDQLQSAGLTQMNAGSIENLADGKVITKNPDTPVEAQSLDRNTTDMCQLEENLAQGNVGGKRRKKRNKKKAKVNDKVQSLAQSQMDTGLTDDVAEGNLPIENPEVQDEIQSTDQAKINRPIQVLAEVNANVKKTRHKKRRKKAKGKDEVSNKIDVESTENLDEVNVNIKIPDARDEVASRGLKVMDAGSTENLTNGSLTSENPKTNDGGQIIDTGPSEDNVKAGKKKKKHRIHAEGDVTIDNPKVQDESQSIDQAQMNTPTQDLAEGNVIVNRKKKRKSSKKARVKDEFSGKMDAKSTENVVIVDVKNIISKTRDEVSGGPKVVGAGSTENLTRGNLSLENQKNKDEGPNTEKVLINTEPVKDSTKSGKRKKKRKSTREANIDSESCVSIGRTIVSVRRKLLVLDINGLLADVVFPAPKACNPDAKLYGRAVFRRPFCDDFLKFCFQNFYVGIWSSRSKKVVDKVVSYLLGAQEHKLLFCWDMDHTTKSGFNTLENRHKPLVCKELRKIWEEDDPNRLWKKGDFNESNTLLLDDSPYKALLNPLHTSIFPHPYQHSDKNDYSLGPGGDLRVYLEGLAASENVQKYVEQHPFGQSPITEQDLRWEFYDRVLKNIQSSQLLTV